MDGRLLAATVVGCVVAALVAPAVPLAAAVAVVVLGLLTRHPGPVAVGLVLCVGARAHGGEEALAVPPPPQVAGTATLVTDPSSGRTGARAEVRLDGRRYRLEVARDDAAVLAPLLVGDHVVVRGRVRPFRGVPEGWRRSRHLVARVVADDVVRGPPAAPWAGAANAVHRTLAAGARPLGQERAALFLGLVVGDDRAQGEVVRHRFRAAGLSHLLAVSGQNVAFLLLVAAPVLTRATWRWRWLLTAALLVAFVAVTRAEPSVLRATVMALVVVTAAARGSQVGGARALAWCVVALLCVDPALVHSVGFRLSVSATAGLVLAAGPMAERLPGPAWVRAPLAVTVVAQLATAPVLWSFTPGVPPVSVVANLLAVPAAGAVMALGMTTGLVAGMVRDDVAAVLQWPTGLLLGWIDAVARWAAQVPLPPLGPGRLALVTACGGVAVAVVRAARDRRAGWPATRAAIVVAVLGVVAAATLAPAPLPPGRHRLGPSVVEVDTCGGRTVVVGGSTRAVLEGLAVHGVTRADAVRPDRTGGGSAAWTRTTAVEVAEALGATVTEGPSRPVGASGHRCRLPP